jgi:hypothetical protein
LNGKRHLPDDGIDQTSDFAVACVEFLQGMQRVPSPCCARKLSR